MGRSRWPLTTDWLSRALGLEEWIVNETIERLERAQLVRRSLDRQTVLEIEYEFADSTTEEVIASELPAAITQPGLQIVASWLDRARRHFDSWPPARPDVDDVVA